MAFLNRKEEKNERQAGERERGKRFQKRYHYLQNWCPLFRGIFTFSTGTHLIFGSFVLPF